MTIVYLTYILLIILAITGVIGFSFTMYYFYKKHCWFITLIPTLCIFVLFLGLSFDLPAAEEDLETSIYVEGLENNNILIHFINNEESWYDIYSSKVQVIYPDSLDVTYGYNLWGRRVNRVIEHDLFNVLKKE